MQLESFRLVHSFFIYKIRLRQTQLIYIFTRKKTHIRSSGSSTGCAEKHNSEIYIHWKAYILWHRSRVIFLLSSFLKSASSASPFWEIPNQSLKSLRRHKSSLCIIPFVSYQSTHFLRSNQEKERVVKFGKFS